jgi:hypothetical protein
MLTWLVTSRPIHQARLALNDVNGRSHRRPGLSR